MKKILIGIISVALSSGVLFYHGQPDGRLHVYFLNVGQGDAILIRTPSGKNIMVDSGPDQNILPELQQTLPYFANRIDYAILTHTDRDHIQGFISVFHRYRVGAVLLTGAYKPGALYRAFLKAMQQEHIPALIADASKDLVFDDGVKIDILFPFHPIVGPVAITNNTAIIVKIVFGTNEILLTGDAEAPEEETLLRAHVNLDSDVLKIAHHGSKTSTIPAFLNAVSPEYSVISVGKHNTYHHPHPSTMKRLETYGTRILRTDESGRIEFIFDKNGITKINTQSTRTISAPSERSFSSNRS